MQKKKKKLRPLNHFTNLDAKEYFLRIREEKAKHGNKDCGIGFLIQTFHFVFIAVVFQTHRKLGAWGGWRVGVEGRGLADKNADSPYNPEKHTHRRIDGVRVSDQTKTRSHYVMTPPTSINNKVNPPTPNSFLFSFLF